MKYRAFLSYSHADTRLARRIHARLEAVRIDRELIGRETAQGTVPPSLRPIFRDRHDFEAGGDLAALTLAALDESAALIVLASPRSAGSHYANEEVRLFKSRHPGRTIIPLIVGGAPGTAVETCFPPALRYDVRPDGTLTDDPVDILAADLRESADGFDLALAKVVARLLGLPPDDIYRRAERERSRQSRMRAGVLALIGVLAVTGGGFFWQSRQQQASLAEIAKLVAMYSPISSADAAEPAVTRSLTEALTAIVSGAAADPRYAQALALLNAGKSTEAEPLLKLVAEDKAKRADKDARDAAAAYRHLASIAAFSDHKRAREYYAEAARLDPADTESMLEAGRLEFEAGQLDEAANQFHRVLGLAKAGDEAFSRAHKGLGDIAYQHGDLNTARADFLEAQRLGARLVAATPGDPASEIDLSNADERLGDIEVNRGKLDDALASYRAEQTIVERMARLQPQNTAWQRSLSRSDERIGGIFVSKGDFSDALDAYQASMVNRQRLAGSDPSNVVFQDDLSVSYGNIGDLLFSENDWARSLTAYQEAVRILRPLTQSDPGNARWQSALSASDDDVGDVLMKLGRLPEAELAYRESMAIREPLAKSAPDNAVWQHDLEVSEVRSGDVALAEGNLPAALQAYKNVLAIAERLAGMDPHNAARQEDLALSYGELESVLVKQGKLKAALDAASTSQTIISRLTASDPTNKDWQHELADADATIGDVLTKEGNLRQALTAYRAGLKIAEALSAADPKNAEWRQSLADLRQKADEPASKAGN